MHVLTAWLQIVAVAAIVGVCAVYAAWSLVPGAARRGIATAVVRWLPAGARWSPLQNALQPARGGCGAGCGSCGGSAVARNASPATSPPSHRRVIPLVVEPRR